LDLPPAEIPQIDLTRPSIARVYDYWLGGKDSFPADRELSGKLTEMLPLTPVLARENRAFLGRAVGYVAAQGVSQFIDAGAGLPTSPAVHEIARSRNPGTRILYVDNDPLVLAHARALLTSSPQGACDYIDVDLREPGKILARASQTLNLTQPVAVLLLAVLHFIPDADDPWGIVTRLLDGITGDAYLVICHAASDLNPSEIREAARRNNERSPVPIGPRSRPQIARFFSGTQMMPPGLVTLGSWWPDRPDDGTGDSDLGGHVGMGWRAGRPPRRE
jgi:S-adenosyl methyltransferase